MKIRDFMSADVLVLEPSMTIQKAAQHMHFIDVGGIPIGKDGHLVGMLTDNDILSRAVATGKSPETPIEEIMTADVKYCFDDEDVDRVAEVMGYLQVKRLPVLSRERRLVGIVTLSDLSLSQQAYDAAVASIPPPRPAARMSASPNVLN